jgi:HIV Tat-specific factor 1
MINKNVVNNSSSQKDEFINNIRNLVNVNITAQTAIPTYEGLKIKLRSIIDTAKTVYRNLANVLPEFNNHIAAGKLISTMYLKIHQLMIETKSAHIKDYLVEEKKILKIRKIALKTERNCLKCLLALYDSIQSTAVLIIPNYEKIVTLQNQLENMYNLRPRTAIYYGEEDGNFEDPKDDDYNPSDDEDDQDDEEFDFDDYDNDSEYDPSDDEEDDDEEFDFDEDDSDSDYDYEDEDEYSTEDSEFMNEYNNDPEYLLDEDDEEDEEELLIFDEHDDDDSEYTPSESDEDEEEFDFDEEDDNDSDYTPSEADEDEEEFDFDEEDDDDDDDDDDYDYEDEEENREADRQFISDYLNDPDYNPDEDEEDDLEYDFSYLNKTVDDNGNIILKAGIADDNDEEDPDYDPSEDEDEDEDEDDEEEYFKYNSNENILNICKRRFENGNVVFRWVKMTKEQAEKKYDEDYVCDEN